MADLIDRQAAIDKFEPWLKVKEYSEGELNMLKAVLYELRFLPSAQPERVIYASMSDEEFEKWLYEHGICNPNIHESIPCDVVPLLIDNAISELPSAQPEIIYCKDCTNWDTTWTNDWTPNYHYCPIIDGVRKDDFYCADAERRTDEQT